MNPEISSGFDLEDAAVMLIAYAGDSKSYSMEALDWIHEKNLEEVERCLAKSREALQSAHNVHSAILAEEGRRAAKGEQLALSFLLIHASNHFASAELSLDFAERIIHLVAATQLNQKGV